MSARIIFRKFGRIVSTVFITIGVSVGIAFVVIKFFTIEVIEVQGSGLNIIVDQKKLSKNLLFFPTEQLRNQLLSENPLLLDVKIQKKLPHTLVIVAKLRTAIAHLQTNTRMVDIDEDGMIISDSMPNETLPILFFDVTPIRIGQKITKQQIQSALSSLVHLGSIVTIDSIKPLDEESIQLSSRGLHIYVAQQSNFGDVSSTLQTLLNGVRIKGTLPALIDLRFAKPVISY